MLWTELSPPSLYLNATVFSTATWKAVGQNLLKTNTWHMCDPGLAFMDR